MKTLTDKQRTAVEAEVCMMLHASRDCLRNQGQDTKHIRFDVRDAYFGEAFGIMRALQVLGYGYFGANNVMDRDLAIRNLKWWFSQLEQRVLDEEHFDGDHQCAHCFERYGQDAARRRGGEPR